MQSSISVSLHPHTLPLRTLYPAGHPPTVCQLLNPSNLIRRQISGQLPCPSLLPAQSAHRHSGAPYLYPYFPNIHPYQSVPSAPAVLHLYKPVLQKPRTAACHCMPQTLSGCLRCEQYRQKPSPSPWQYSLGRSPSWNRCNP